MYQLSVHLGICKEVICILSSLRQISCKLLGFYFLVVNVSLFFGRKEKCYKFVNEEGTESASVPHLPAPPPTSPPPLPAGPSPPPPPPSPPPAVTGADHQVQDMDIEEEPAGNMTDQLSMFYSEIEGATPTNGDHQEEEAANSGASSPPSSPVQVPGKKRKKVEYVSCCKTLLSRHCCIIRNIVSQNIICYFLMQRGLRKRFVGKMSIFWSQLSLNKSLLIFYISNSWLCSFFF